MKKWIEEKDLAAYPEISQEEAAEILRRCTDRTLENVKIYGTGFFGPNSIGNFYDAGENQGWTTGFHTGEIWLAYENAESSVAQQLLKAAGSGQVRSFLHRIENRIDTDHHDMGFLYSPSCVAAWKLNRDEKGRRAAILAADQLTERFQEKGQFLQAWGVMNEPGNYRFIIDCLLNLPLLYWASEETGEEKYRDIAERHIHTAMANAIRPDGSCWHTVFMNPETGQFDHGATCQGYRDGSAWARGQAWGVYGTAIAYKNTGEPQYYDYFRRVTSYFLHHLPKDLVPYWDLSFGEGDGLAFTDPRVQHPTRDKGIYDCSTGIQPRDSSAGVIAACGMLEMAKYLPAADSACYQGIARKLMKAALDHCFEPDYTKSNGLLLHGTYCHHSPYNTCTPKGTDECVLWGDYYFMEALNRLVNPDWVMYW